MLNHHSKIAVPYESHLLNTFMREIPYYGDLQNATNLERLVDDILVTDVIQDWDPKLDRAQLLQSIQEPTFKAVFEGIMNHWTKATGKSRWGEKTPHHVDYWETLSDFFPDAKVIHIYRDGRDVALSLKRARFGPKTIYTAAKYWTNYLDRVRKVQKEIPKEHFFEVRYETLLDQSESVLKDVCSFLGETFENGMLDFHQTKAVYNTDAQNRANLHKPLIKGNQQKWKQEMSARSVSLFESVAGDELKQLGYPHHHGSDQILSSRTILWEKTKAFVLKNSAKLKNFKGIRDGWIRFRIKVRNRFVSKLASQT